MIIKIGEYESAALSDGAEQNIFKKKKQAVMLSDFWIKQHNKIGKIFKNSKFHFFKIEPELGKTNLLDLKNPRKNIFSDLHAILEQNRILNSKSSKISQNIQNKHIF